MEMDLNVLMLITLLGMLLAIFAGIHIALALGATAMIGTFFIFLRITFGIYFEGFPKFVEPHRQHAKQCN